MNVILQKRFAQQVLAHLKALEMTRADLARAMDVSQAYVDQYLKGRRSPGADVVERFAKALNLDPAELYIPAGASIVLPKKLERAS